MLTQLVASLMACQKQFNIVYYSLLTRFCWFQRQVFLKGQSQSRYGQETQPMSLFYLFVRVYADLCTVKTKNFWYNKAIVL